MGKYDNEVKKCMFSFEERPRKNLKLINKSIQTSYNVIKDYYMCTVTVRDVVEILDSLEQAYEQNIFISKLNKIRGEYRTGDKTQSTSILSDIKNIGDNVLTLLCILSDKTAKEILNETYKLYLNKNASYNDVWYHRGTSGVCVDINRKTERLNVVIENNNKITDGETLYETAMDTLVFATFLLVSVTYIDVD